MSNQWYDIDTLQWTDDDIRQWGFSDTTLSGIKLHQIWTDDRYVYAATSIGLDVIDIDTEQKVSTVTKHGEYTTVWSDNTHVFIGSVSSGIKIIRQDNVEEENINNYVNDYMNAPSIKSDNIKYIHGNNNRLICCTDEGVDIIQRGSNYIVSTAVTGARKCFVTPTYNYFYYTISGSDFWRLCRLDNKASDWIEPDAMYTAGSGFLTSANKINDIYITEHTSTNGDFNTLFIAADTGVYIYDEGTGDFNIFTTVS